MFGMGMGELLLILVVALLVVGPDKLPQAAKSIGKGIRDFRRHTLDLQETIEKDEQIGAAVRELKSALTGDTRAAAPFARPQPPARFPIEATSPPAELAAGAVAAGPAATDAAGADAPGPRPAADGDGPAATAPRDPDLPRVVPAGAVAKGEPIDPAPSGPSAARAADEPGRG